MKVKKIYQRFYDNPYKGDGSDKPNDLIGEFFVIHQISEDFYTELFIGMPTDSADNRVFLIEGKEISGVNGGTVYIAIELPELVVKGFENINP